MQHAALTQSEALLGYDRYEQLIIGAAGGIVEDEFTRLAHTASRRPGGSRRVPVTILAARIHPDDAGLRQTTAIEPGSDGDTREYQDREALNKALRKYHQAMDKLAQREQYPFGRLMNRDGTDWVRHQDVDYSGLDVRVVPIGTDNIHRS